ncbi:hypothetical protein QFZ30_001985 [Arthrobacter pascens]|uniref:ABATE domain-containing protein n=1 Tax=Arthrobacter pascens TaxID=1677 RepID=UPI0027902B1D|nr:ABATE domain-containing protein [Arthrobacter pascens]MDQ0678603.1 hypothetical protein [Arthrobacter pascens]
MDASVLMPHTEGVAPDPESVEAINRALTAVPSAALLRYTPDEGPRRVAAAHPLTQIVAYAIAQIGEDAAALLTGPTRIESRYVRPNRVTGLWSEPMRGGSGAPLGAAPGSGRTVPTPANEKRLLKERKSRQLQGNPSESA